MELYLLSALVFGILSALLAKQKQKNPLHWFFIGFVTGVFGLIAILVLKKSTGFKSYRAYSIDAAILSQKYEQSKAEKKNPALEMAGAGGASFNDLPDEDDVLTCPNCRTMHAVNTKSCPVCDTPFFR